MPEIRLVLAEDIPQIAEFCSRFPEDGRPRQFWLNRLNHWWADNPAMTESWPRGYLLLGEGELQGVCLCIPVRLVVDGKVQLGALRSTWRVLPAYRSKSLQLSMTLDAEISHLVNINGTPNATAVKVMQMLEPYWTCLWPEMDSSIHWGSPLALFSRLLKAGPIHRKLPHFIPSSREVTLETAEAEVNRHWLEIQDSAKNGPVRDWRYWSWFSIHNPSFSCTLFYHPVTVNDRTLPLCALVADFNDGRLHLADIWPSDAPDDQLNEMVGFIITTARRHGFHSIEIAHLTPSLTKATRRLDRLKDVTQPACLWLRHPFPEHAQKDGHWPLPFGDSLL